MDALDVARESTKAALGQIPILGAVFTGLFEVRRSALIEGRLDQFQEDLRAEMASMLEQDFPKDYIQSHNYAHLILLAIDHTQRTRDREKRRLYARALVTAGTKEWAPQCDLAEELLDTLAAVSPIELQMLKAAWDRCAQVAPPGGPYPLSGATFNAAAIAPQLADLHLTEAEIGAYLAKLQRLGLAEVASVNLSGFSTSLFRLTPLFERLQALIRMGGRSV